MQQIHGFFEDLLIQKSDVTIRPVTWLELFALYKIRGYANPVKNSSSVSHAKPTLDKHIHAFKNKCRAIAIKVCTTEIEKELFTPFKILGDNLSGIGISGKHQAPSFNIFVNELEQKEIATNLFLLNHSLSRVRIGNILQGQRAFLIRPFIMRGRSDWCNNIKQLSLPKLIDYDSWIKSIMACDKWSTRHKKDVLLQCSRCFTSDPIKSHNFSLFNVDKQIKCCHCKKQSMSRFWKCPCGENWFLCNTHKWYANDCNKPTCAADISNRPSKSVKTSHINNKVQNDDKDKDDNNPKNKKARGKQPKLGDGTIQGEGDPNLMADHQELLEFEAKMESEMSQQHDKRKPHNNMTLTASPNMIKRLKVLGPKMNAKFGDHAKDPPKYTNDELNKAKWLGENARKRGGDHLPAPLKKPRSTGHQSSESMDELSQAISLDHHGSKRGGDHLPEPVMKSSRNDGDSSNHGLNHGAPR